jgi:PAS domain S-box-containing protein
VTPPPGRREGERLSPTPDVAAMARIALESAGAAKQAFSFGPPRAEPTLPRAITPSSDELETVDRLLHDAEAEHALFTLDRAGHVLQWNRAAELLTGYEAGEIEGRSAGVLHTESDRAYQGPERLLETAARQGFAAEEGWRVRRNGARFRADVVITAARSAEGELTGYTVVMRDVTQREHAAEARFRGLMDQATDSITILQADGVIVDVNRRMCELLGHAREEMLGHPIRDFTETITTDAGRADLNALVMEGPGQFRRIEMRRADGRRAIVDFSVSRVRHGDLDLLLSIGRDVTDQLQLETQLRQALKMEAIGRLAGGIAHDFNNLLTAITGNAEYLLKRIEAEDPLHEVVSEIEEAGDRAAELTRQLLAFSRQQVLRPRVVDLAQLVRGTEKMLGRVIGEHIRLITRYYVQPARVLADPVQIEQVILNLALNARDAMPDGGTLTIDVASVRLGPTYAGIREPVTPGDYVMLSVSDDGEGMPHDVQPHIFEPFFTTKEVGKGTGLGLATVYGIIKQSDGYIWLSSEPGKGSTFKFYLPAVTSRTLQTAVHREEARGGNERILLVEDDDLVRKLARRALEQWGYEVTEAGDPILAIRLASECDDIDLLVTDVIMPGMSGRALAEELAPKRPRMKVLYTSGYTDEAILRHGILESGLPFLQKPYTPDSLARRIREVLDG